MGYLRTKNINGTITLIPQDGEDRHEAAQARALARAYERDGE